MALLNIFASRHIPTRARNWASLFAALLLALCLTLQPTRIEAATADGIAPQATIAAAHFAEPLIATRPTSSAEDAGLAEALQAYAGRARVDDFSALTSFIAAHPHSGWNAALQTNLGLSYLHYGYFSKAMTAWQQAWAEGKDATDPRAKLLVDRAVGELARLYAGMGQFDNVAAVFREIGSRPIAGSATEAVQQAREQLNLVTKDPRHLFNCGPVALKALILSLDAKDERGSFLQWYRVGPKGTNLTELGTLAQKAGLSYQIIHRSPGQPVPLHAVVHWKVGHFSAIIGKANGRYQVEDLGFPGSYLWITEGALDTETSGYFLIPSNQASAPNWRPVGAAEASGIWGKGPTNSVQPGHPGDPPAKGKPNNCPLCGYDFQQAVVGLTLTDLPVGYTPPIGPTPSVRLTYNQREDSQPAVFNFYNVSPKWSLDWQTYVVDDPLNPGANVSRILPGGGAYYYTGYNSANGQFDRQSTDGSILVLASQSPITYRRQLGDGSVEIYAQPDGSSSYPRKVFLSQVVDPQGNAVTLSYDGAMRLLALTDATGRQTTFSYTVAGMPLLVSKITDPFGRAATLGYDASGRLTSITDIIGLTSSFHYDANSLIDSLTTPYGTTSFAYTAPGASGPPRFVEATDPLGYHERVEWFDPAPIPDSDPAATVPQGMPLPPTNQYLSYRDTFYWDKEAYVLAGCTPTGGCDFTKARSTHFLHFPGSAIKSTTIESIKYPLENRIWYNYPGQTSSIFTGTLAMPSAVGRVLDDGTTQKFQYAYDAAGYFKLTQAIDPIGRTTTYTYSNQIDLAAIAQTTQYGVLTTLAQFTYDTRHRPVLVTNAAGQTTKLSYNGAGQLTAATDPLGHTTTYNYTSGNLTSIANANSVTAATYTYDAYNRVATFTDSEGWTASYAYDAADRVTKVTYPDGTAETYTYDKLDLASSQDRLGRRWVFAHDANRRLTSMTASGGDQTLLGYNRIGQVTTRTDPKGYVTTWEYDGEGRPKKKIYADTSAVTIGYENTTSRIKTITDALGQVKQFGYAKDDLPLSITYLSAVNPTPNVSFAYDPYFARLISRTDGAGTTQYSYVPVGSPGALAVQQETTPIIGGTIAYAYDALGRILSRTVSGSGTETFQYDALGRLSNDSNDLGAFTLTYLGQTSQITQRQLASSTFATNWSYLPNSGDRRLASVGSVGLSSSNHTTFDYSSNADGFTTQVVQTSETAIPYPAVGSQTASYNNLNQLTNLSGQARTYDANGNLLSDGIRTYSWDAENRLVGISYPGQPGKATAFAYDGLGRRISIGSTPAGGGATVTTSYLWCGFDICQARDAANSITRAYYSQGEFVPGSPAQLYYYGFDQLGSVRRVYASGQAPAFDYDPYGNPLQATTPLTGFNYAGMIHDTDSGLDLAVFRVYDHAAGRFLSRDPLGEDSEPSGNLYTYGGGDPIGTTDPSGLCYLFCGGGASGSWGLPRQPKPGHPPAAPKPSKKPPLPPHHPGKDKGPAGFPCPPPNSGFGGGGLPGSGGSGNSGPGSGPSQLPAKLVRVIPSGTPAATLGRPANEDVFVTTPEAIEGLDAASIAERLTIEPSETGYDLYEFPTPEEGLAVPILRDDPGFVGGGYTAGGAPEYVIPNGPIPPGTTVTTVP